MNFIFYCFAFIGGAFVLFNTLKYFITLLQGILSCIDDDYYENYVKLKTNYDLLVKALLRYLKNKNVKNLKALLKVLVKLNLIEVTNDGQYIFK